MRSSGRDLNPGPYEYDAEVLFIRPRRLTYLLLLLLFPVKKTELTARGIRCADHATPSIRKVGTNFANKRRSVGIVRLRTKGHGVFLLWLLLLFLNFVMIHYRADWCSGNAVHLYSEVHDLNINQITAILTEIFRFFLSPSREILK
jgi:hypothetical protein